MVPQTAWCAGPRPLCLLSRSCLLRAIISSCKPLSEHRRCAVLRGRAVKSGKGPCSIGSASGVFDSQAPERPHLARPPDIGAALDRTPPALRPDARSFGAPLRIEDSRSQRMPGAAAEVRDRAHFNRNEIALQKSIHFTGRCPGAAAWRAPARVNWPFLIDLIVVL